MYALPNKTQHKLIVKVRGGFNATNNNSSSSNNNTAKQQQQQHQNEYIEPGSSLTRFNSSALLDESGFNADLQSHLPQPIFHSRDGQQNNKHKLATTFGYRAHKQYITPEHNEMIKYVHQSWKGVEPVYKKSAKATILTTSTGATSAPTCNNTAPLATTPTGPYHHISAAREDSFQPFDLEAFWENRIFKRLTETNN